jgi:O-antigen/teichoic acid export membrane protein
MSTAAKAISANGLKRRALSLGAVKAFDHLMQFLLPVVLVRCLDTESFGEYRLLWLVVGTVVGIAMLNMCGSLFFFVPRSAPEKRRLYVHHTMLYMALAGIVCGLAVSPWNPLLPAAMLRLAEYGQLVPAFIAFWMAALLLDYLPTIDERIRLQAYATMTVSGLRVLLVGAAAWWSGDLRVVLWVLMGVVALKLGVLLVYVHRYHGLGRPWLSVAGFSEQFRHSAPFGLSNALYSLRAQSDQWVAASLFAISSFAAFSIAAIVGQVVQLFRHSVMEAFMPTMSRMQAAGDVNGMMDMNRRANVLVGTFLYPMLASGFVFAEEIIGIVYTAAYAEAAPVMRLYVAGMVAMVVEIGSILLLLREGAFAVKVTAAALAVSVLVSFGGAHAFGLTGAAAGSVLVIYLDRAITLARVSRRTGIPLARIQNWGALAYALTTAAIAGALAAVVTSLVVPEMGDFMRLVAGAATLFAAYAAMNWKRLRK